MADDILAFQAGREAAIAGMPRDGRRSADWLEGFDQIASETIHNDGLRGQNE